MNDPISVIHDKEAQEYRVEVSLGQWVLVTYVQQGDVLILNHSEVPRALRGQGYGAVLMEHVLAQIEEDGLKVIPVCPYIKTYIKRNERWQSLLK